MDSDDEKQNANTHHNQPYDESLEVPDAEEIASLYTPTPRVPVPQKERRSRGDTPPDSRMSEQLDDDDEFETGAPPGGLMQQQQALYGGQQHQQHQQQLNDEDVEETDDEDDEDDDEDDDSDGVIQGGPPAQGGRPPPPPSHEKSMYGGPGGLGGPGLGGPGLGGPGLGGGLGPIGSGPSGSGPAPLGPVAGGGGDTQGDDEDSGSEDDDDDDEDEDDEDEENGGQMEGAYDPAEYEHLAVTPEIKELFQYITRYTPQTIDLDHKLRPFIPDFIPAVGDIDAFIKIPRPDGKPDTLGLTVLDEPCAKQSDPTVLDLQLRAISKQPTVKSVAVKSIDEADKNPKAIENWIESITELHRVKPAHNVHYTKNMPDVDSLMQEWPGEFEDLLKEVGLPTADLDCDLSTYVDMICAILDIPIYKSRVQSLHVLFTLFSEFKNSQHFKGLADTNQLDNALKEGGGEAEVSDTLIL